MPDPEVVVLGDANPDLVLRGDVVPRFGQAEQLLDAADLVLGGSGAIVACGLARLGVAAALVAAVGDDLYGRFVLEALSARGVDTRAVRVLPGQPTGLSVVLSAGERAILTLPGTIPQLRPEDVDAGLLRAAQHVHAASYFLLDGLRAGLPGLLGIARGRGATTSLDTNWDPTQRWDTAAMLDATDLLLPNAVELVAMAGTGGDPESLEAQRRAAAVVTARGVTVVLKAGAEGGRLWGPSGTELVAPGIEVDVVDTTGAGDSFDAGYLAAHVQGFEPAECLRRAAVCGSLSVQGVGGTGAQATEVELVAALAR